MFYYTKIFSSNQQELRDNITKLKKYDIINYQNRKVKNMSVIYKYPIKIDEMNNFYVELPIGAEIISILCEGTYDIFIYAIVNPKEEKVIKRNIIWLGTGWEIDKNIEDKIKYYTFLGTYKTKNNLVWHFWIEFI